MNSRDERNSYQIAFDMAAEILRQSDVEYVCRVCGTTQRGNSIILPFFHEEYSITLPEVEIQPQDLSIYEHILMLHYLTTLSDKPARGEYVKFKNLPGASFYDPTYQRRGPARIAAKFGNDTELFLVAGGKLGGIRSDYGDVSVRLHVLPKIDAVVVLYRGDEEFPSEAAILYKDDIINFLPLEDIAVLSGLIASRLQKTLS
jgi:hypothetical protein